MSKLDYAYEKLRVAVSSLATSERALNDRLYSAAITVIPVRDQDFDEYPELKSQWLDLKSKLNSKPAVGDEGTIRATLDSATDSELRNIAEAMFELFQEVAVIELRSR